MKRAAPEELPGNAGPLFAFAQSTPARRGAEGDPRTVCESPMNQRAGVDPSSAAWNRAEVGMQRAANRAEKIAPEWQVRALELVRQHACANASFLAEEVPHALPDGADPRAFGAVMRAAASMGYVVADGWAPANTSNRSPKTKWRSLIYQGTRGA